MAEKNYVTYGDKVGYDCSSCSKAITGCRFSLSVMADNYIDVILSSLSKTNTSKVWKQTDKLSTVYRGKQLHVEDAVEACFTNAWRKGVHMTMEMTFSKGCPGYSEADNLFFEDDNPVNRDKIKDIHFPVNCKISLYPMGIPDYMKYIATVVNHAIDLGLYEKSSHYCTILKGDIHEIFDYIHYVNTYCGENLSHYVFEVILSVNSPIEE